VRQGITSNAAALFATRVAAGGFSLTSFVLAARWLDGDHFGRLMVIVVSTGLANLATTFGTDDEVVRSVARGSLTSAATAVRLQWAIASAAVAVSAVVAILAGEDLGWWLLVGLLGLFPLAVTTTVTAVARGLERATLLPAVAGLGGAGQLAGFVVAERVDAGYGGFVVAVVVAQVVAAVAGAGVVLRAQPVPLRGGPSMGVLAKRSWRFAAMVLASAVTVQAGVLLVAVLTNETAAGTHGLATRAFEMLRLIPGALVGALFPVMARGGDMGRWNGRRLTLLGLALVVAGFGVAPALAWVSDVDGVAWPTRWLAVGLLGIVWRLAVSARLVADDREDVVLRVALWVLPVAVGSLAVGAATAGAAGAASASSAIVAVHASALWWVERSSPAA